MHVVIIGGGACGMMAAWDLCLAGARVTVLERERRPGGQGVVVVLVKPG